MIARKPRASPVRGQSPLIARHTPCAAQGSPCKIRLPLRELGGPPRVPRPSWSALFLPIAFSAPRPAFPSPVSLFAASPYSSLAVRGEWGIPPKAPQPAGVLRAGRAGVGLKRGRQCTIGSSPDNRRREGGCRPGMRLLEALNRRCPDQPFERWKGFTTCTGGQGIRVVTFPD